MKTERQIKDKIKELQKELESYPKDTKLEKAIYLVDEKSVRKDINVLLWVLG